MPEGALLWKTLFDTHDTAETANQTGSQHNGQKTGKKRAQRTASGRDADETTILRASAEIFLVIIITSR